MRTDLRVYVGSPENDQSGNYLYLDLTIEKFAVVNLIETSALDNYDGETVLQEFQKFLNKVAIFSRALQLPVKISPEELLHMCVELDCDADITRQIHNLVVEFLKRK